jgi:hypothetical protein
MEMRDSENNGELRASSLKERNPQGRLQHVVGRSRAGKPRVMRHGRESDSAEVPVAMIWPEEAVGKQRESQAVFKINKCNDAVRYMSHWSGDKWKA